MLCALCKADFPSSGGETICTACQAKLTTATETSARIEFSVPSTIHTDGAAAKTDKGVSRLGIEKWKSIGSKECRISIPMSVAVRPPNELLLLDEPDEYRILRFDNQGLCLGVFMHIPIGEDDGSVDDPMGLCVDASGRIFIPDAGNDCIAIWNADGTFSHSVGRTGTGPGEFAHPTDVDVDTDGYLYVADSFNRRIQKLSEDGLVSLEINQLGDLGEFRNPVAVTIDIEGNIYAGDDDLNVVAIFSADGKLLDTIPGRKEASDFLDRPSDVRLDGKGALYIADRHNLRIRRLTPKRRIEAVVDVTGGNGDPVAGGDIALLGECVIIPDAVNECLLCMAFEPVGDFSS